MDVTFIPKYANVTRAEGGNAVMDLDPRSNSWVR